MIPIIENGEEKDAAGYPSDYGTADISDIADGIAKGAIQELNSNAPIYEGYLGVGNTATLSARQSINIVTAISATGVAAIWIWLVPYNKLTLVGGQTPNGLTITTSGSNLTATSETDYNFISVS